MRIHNPVSRFFNLKATRKAAIEAKCAQCMGCTQDSIETGFKSDISDCSSYDCALRQFRPYQKVSHPKI